MTLTVAWNGATSKAATVIYLQTSAAAKTIQADVMIMMFIGMIPVVIAETKRQNAEATTVIRGVQTIAKMAMYGMEERAMTKAVPLLRAMTTAAVKHN